MSDAPSVSDLTAPRDGSVPVIDRIQPLLAWCDDAESAPDEPVAVDAERASSFRYSSRAYLVQLRTEAAGTALIDPLAFSMPQTLLTLLGERQWVLHAAGQDLPSLGELGMQPASLFDTELAARLLGMDRVGLGAVVEDTLALHLAKEHSAADWSKRPLPAGWLTYAALDVEVLVDVRDVLAERLREAGKLEWALQEFEHERLRDHGPTRSSSWRGLHGLGGLRTQKQLAAAREMWIRRDEIASGDDLSPHRVIKDRDLVAAAKEAPRGREAFDRALPAKLRKKDIWWQAARSGIELPQAHLPERNEPSYPPPHKLWSKKYPETWERYQVARAAVGERAEDLEMPPENLLQPALLRHWVWEHEQVPEESVVESGLLALGARPWQVEQAAPVIHRALTEQS
ncbi:MULTISPECIES: HRDC domain-containing protein [Brachybacterium]|uniref:Ribonuclease D n=1 Tax=Brachybacterium alimentarium TaxID=47845 RepID=A0A2A3YLD1_9MICO|nr:MULTISPECIES: HRDC domain-containing protein [Brachybacterium]PCC34192.1 ribonuclease D [Brachybacterium alimentarium]PCC39905.1 ribonuclease D [Brachybacterium alimentarium]RCS65888.1 ribonuclease D [Brachybacterium alimentarium]RCS67181.1 ribonuclease D [Brachybacterium sp. JB7]RCS69789.1 ribonuclease D [Brachybacterium alimentarium]